jgi:MOSC domain-containing protein YiiM
VSSIRPLQVISINVGLPREVMSDGDIVETAIYKNRVAGRVAIRRLNIDGDRQADLTVHGGPEKAVYACPSEHYPAWREELGEPELPWGAFGENLTTSGLVESEVCIGDRLRVGSAELIVTQPRTPCFKLAIRFNRPDMLKRLLRGGRTGFYLSVAREGDAAAGDEVAIVSRDPNGVTIADIVDLYASRRTDRKLLERASNLPALPAGWRDFFQQRLR